MTRVIVLTAEQAAHVAGETTPGHALAPVPYEDFFILGANVLQDPAHAAHHEFLAALPQEDLG